MCCEAARVLLRLHCAYILSLHCASAPILSRRNVILYKRLANGYILAASSLCAFPNDDSHTPIAMARFLTSRIPITAFQTPHSRSRTSASRIEDERRTRASIMGRPRCDPFDIAARLRALVDGVPILRLYRDYASTAARPYARSTFEAMVKAAKRGSAKIHPCVARGPRGLWLFAANRLVARPFHAGKLACR